ncbi:MAG: TlpA disulfide reductase family protein [Acidobacteriaceae bacterium]
MRKTRPTLRSAVLLLALCALPLTSCDRGDHPARIGSPAPQFTLADGAQNVDLARLRGHIVVLHFWATWCAPCVVEMPSLVALQRRLPQVTVLAISQDEDPAVYRQFLLDYHVGLLTLRDPSARIPHLYGTIKIPETYIIDSRGILRRKFVSAQDWTSPEIIDYLTKL